MTPLRESLFPVHMIGIISQEYEGSTDDVIDWIHSFGHQFKRYNDLDFFSTPFKVEVSNETYNAKADLELAELNVIWFRRGLAAFNDDVSIEGLSELTNRSINSMLNVERKSALNAVLDTPSEKWLSHPKSVSGFSKIEALKCASDCGIRIPNSLITNSKQELQSFLEFNQKVIVKPINKVQNIQHGEEHFLQYTEEVYTTDLEKVENHFEPALFQGQIEKDFEIRSFFLNGQFYSMAIFSQKDNKTAVDFRRYNDQEPNRTCPFKLPEAEESKLRDLMDKLNLTTGSIDIIYSKEGEYVFLEVNPIGQFGMVSYPCNYPIEKEIAQFLIQQDERQAV